MKKFLVSVFIGALVGVVLAFAFLFVRVKIADGIAGFLSKERSANAPISELIRSPFGPKTEQYTIPAHEAVVPQTGKALRADLKTMRIELFENGVKVGEHPIASVGREGTAWQTPVGQFEMSYKKENHFSSIGHVWMPYSMHFFGNYFIHGWPYYPDGTPVAEGYSGGCIRMETVDAEQVYAFVDADTALIVVNPDEEGGQEEVAALMTYDISESAPALDVYAYLVADLESGQVLAGKNQKAAAGRDFAPIMTAMISLESLNQYPDVVLDGQLMTVGDVLYALLLTDSDEAAELLYNRRNNAQYLIDMDDRAKSIGMTQTMYEDVYGKNEETTTSLEDTFRLVQYAHWYKPFLIKAMGKGEHVKGDVKFKAIHPLAGDAEYVAGYADAENENMLTLVDVAVGGSGQTRTFVVLVEGSKDAGVDSAKLIEWVKRSVKLDK